MQYVHSDIIIFATSIDTNFNFHWKRFYYCHLNAPTITLSTFKLTANYCYANA